MGEKGAAGSRAVRRLTNELTIAIGGMQCRLLIDDDQLRKAANGKYGSFVTRPAKECLTISVRVRSEEIARTSELEIAESTKGFEVRRHDLRGLIDPDFTKAELDLTWPELSIIGLDCFLRLCYSALAVSHGGILLHSAGVVRNNKGWAFPGKSGSGKSTVASLSKDGFGAVLSDEINLVRREESGWQVYGTPFHGDLGAGLNERAALSGLLFLKKSKNNSIERLGLHEALRRTSRCTLFFGEQTSLVAKVFDTCCEIAGQVPCYEMQFVQNPSFWEMIDDL